MKLLGSMIALLALTASAPAFASDYSTDRYFTQRNARSIQAAKEARAAAPVEHKDARPCDCSCARHADDERAATSRTEPGGH